MLSWAVEWSRGWITGLNTSGSQTRYQADEPLFEMHRKDQEQRVEIDIVNRRWRIGRFSPRLQIGRLERHSSIDFFNYTRDYLRIGLTGTF